MRVLVQPFIREPQPFSPVLGWPKSLSPPRSGKKKVSLFGGGTRSFNLFVPFTSLSVKVIMYNLKTPVSNTRK